MLQQEKQKKNKKMKKGQKKTIKFVFKVAIKKCDLFWPKTFGLKTVKLRKNYKNGGFSGNCVKPKMTPFLKKAGFGMGARVVFY